MKPEDEKNVVGSRATASLGLTYYNGLLELNPVDVNYLRVLLASE